MPAASAELSKEENELFEKMRIEGGGKHVPATEKPEAKSEVKAEAKPDAKEEAKPEAKAETKPEEKKEQKMVPIEAVHEARQTNKDLRKELDAMKQLVGKGEERLQKFIESVQKKADAPAAPKFEDDPAGALRAENEELKKGLAAVNDRLAKQDQASEQGNRISQHANTVKAKEAEFAKAEPNYWKASDYVAEIWRDEFLEAGFDPEQVPAMVFQKALATTGQAASKGKDPAAVIWAIAKRNGFAVKAAEDPKAEAKADAKADGETKLKALEKGLDAAKSAGGGSGPDDLTLASLSQMDDEQIDKLVADKDWWAKQVRRSPLH